MAKKGRLAGLEAYAPSVFYPEDYLLRPGKPRPKTARPTSIVDALAQLSDDELQQAFESIYDDTVRGRSREVLVAELFESVTETNTCRPGPDDTLEVYLDDDYTLSVRVFGVQARRLPRSR